MAESRKLTEKEERAVRFYEVWSRHRRRMKLLRMSARTTLRMVRVYSSTLDAKRESHLEGLALLNGRAVRAYQRLRHHGSAIRFAHRIALRAFRQTGLTGDEP